ncbi:MAG: hypothetical protein ACOYL6_05755 [Bacteriovoracaceae bacterium]
MKKKIKCLNPEEIQVINEHFEEMTFPNDFDFVYESQVPNSAILLMDGELRLCKKNKVVEVIKPGVLIGVYQLLNNIPVKLSWKLGKKSKAILLNKSVIMNALKNKNSPLFNILNTLSPET